MFNQEEYSKEYYIKNKERINNRGKQYRLENKEKIRKYYKKYREEHKEEIAKKDREHYLKNKEHYDEYRKNWLKKNPEPRRIIARKSRRKIRVKVLEMIAHGKPYCKYCGCDDIRLLEINHKNGGGYKERKNCPGSRHIDKIIRGDRKIDDLEILCRICNARHYLERKYGKLPFEITYMKEGINAKSKTQ